MGLFGFVNKKSFLLIQKINIHSQKPESIFFTNTYWTFFCLILCFIMFLVHCSYLFLICKSCLLIYFFFDFLILEQTVQVRCLLSHSNPFLTAETILLQCSHQPSRTILSPKSEPKKRVSERVQEHSLDKEAHSRSLFPHTVGR